MSDRDKYVFVNIVKKCNGVFKGSKLDDKISSCFALKKLSSGYFRLNGFPFRLIDADNDELEGGDPGQAKSMIILKGEYRPDFPEKTGEIMVGEKLKKLLFLQSGIYMMSTSGKWDKNAALPMWKYIVHYSDGSTADIPVIHHVNVKDWYNQESDLPGAKAAYVEETLSAKCAVWAQTWENPHPEKVISSIDIESEGRGIPVILAVTGVK
jgi:hypothetical protein